MIVYLVRHGIAEDRGMAIPDSDRALTTDGIRKMHRIVSGLQRLDVQPAAIWTSPLRRTRETAEILAAGLGVNAVRLCDSLAPASSLDAVCAGLAGAPDSVMVVGHQPDLGELASRLLFGGQQGDSLPFKKGAVAKITWKDGDPTSRSRLEWFLTPAQLRLLGRSGG